MPPAELGGGHVRTQTISLSSSFLLVTSVDMEKVLTWDLRISQTSAMALGRLKMLSQKRKGHEPK